MCIHSCVALVCCVVVHSQVCEEVKKHGVTSFNQVADTLVAMELQEVCTDEHSN